MIVSSENKGAKNSAPASGEAYLSSCLAPLAKWFAWLIKCPLCGLDSYSRTITSGSMFTLIFASQMSYSLREQERSTAGLWRGVYRNENEQTRQILGRIRNASRIAVSQITYSEHSTFSSEEGPEHFEHVCCFILLVCRKAYNDNKS